MKWLFFLFLCGSLSALDVGFDVGVREDSLRWSIGFDEGDGPNIFSELHWKKVRSLNIGLAANTMVYRNLGVGIWLNGGKILSGGVWDRDWWGKNKTRIFSESWSHSNAGTLFDVEVSAQTYLPVGIGILTETAGYCYHMLDLTMINGWRHDYDAGTFGRPMPGLDSQYIAEFYGPFLGFNYCFPICGFLAKVGYNYTFINYIGNGYWNLRTDFNGHFLHKSKNGFGQTYSVELKYVCGENLSLGALFFGRYFKTFSGDDYTFFDVNEEVYSWLKLNCVRWTNLSFYLYFVYQFDFTETRPPIRERLKRVFNNN